MAEISYPFAADSPTGGTKTVSQIEWQNMARQWSADHIDHYLTESSYTEATLPFHAAIVGSDLVVQTGSAWVGGFYYRNDAPLTKPAPTNSGILPRVDLVVLQADMAKGSVNLVIKPGTPSANPKEPSVQRVPGGIWEMPLWAFSLAANSGARALDDRRRYSPPSYVSTPWSAAPVVDEMLPNSFVLDTDANHNETQWEGFNGRDGFVIARHFGKARDYTPSILNSTNAGLITAANRSGTWRRIAPNTFQFTVRIENTTSSTLSASGSNWRLGITLPLVTRGVFTQVVQGFMSNPKKAASLPNYMAITATTSPRTNQLFLHAPGSQALGEGLNGLTKFPTKGLLWISGVIEANDFNE